MRHTRVLIDGMNAAHGLRHAISDLYSTRGRPTGVLFGMLRTVDKLLSTFSPDEITVVWEEGTSWRSSVFPSYKGERIQRIQAMHESDAESYGAFRQYQIPDTIVALHKFGIKQIGIPGLEADDVMGHLVQGRRGDESNWVIVSTDKDMLQLASVDRCKVWNPLKEKLFYQDNNGNLVSNGDSLAPSPRTFLLWRAIEGDTSDSIPGVPGVGPVTVRKLYGNSRWDGGSIKDYITTAKLAGKRGDTLRSSIDLIKRNIGLMELGAVIPPGARTLAANEFLNACQRGKPPTLLRPPPLPVYLQLDKDPSPMLIYFRIRDFDFAYKPHVWKQVMSRYHSLWCRTVHMSTKTWPIPSVDQSVIKKLSKGRI